MKLADLYRHLWTALAADGFAEVDSIPPPRGPEWIFELTDSLGLGPGALVLDLGSGPGEQAVALAERYSVTPVCVDPLVAQLGAARVRALSAGVEVRGTAGAMEEIPLADGSIDLVWMRDALVHTPAPEKTIDESHRVLRPGGHLLLHSAYATERLASHELELLVTHMAVHAASLDRRRVDGALSRPGFERLRDEELGSELAEHYEREDGLGSRALLRLARLERCSGELRERLGEERFRVARGVYHWVVFELMGKLSYRTSLLRKSASQS